MTNEELDYELTLRGVVNLAPSTHRNKVLKLRDLISKEDTLQEAIHRSSEHVMSSTTNIETCQVRIGELKKFVDEAIQIKDVAAIAQLRSRLLHYSHRLEIIQPLTPFVNTKETLFSLVKVLLEEVESALSRFGKRFDRSESAVTSLVPPRTTEDQAYKEPQEIEEHASQILTEAYTRLGISGSNQQNQASNPIGSMAQNTRTGTTHRVQRPDQVIFANGTNVGGTPPLVSTDNTDNHNQPRNNGSISEDYDPQLPGTSSPLESGRARGLAIRSWHDIRFSTGGRGRSTQHPGFGEQEAENNNINSNDEQTFRNIVVNNASLYADLLDRLARRELRTQAPPAERNEDRRMMKAVHNWPFKFRGEKDTTSLNIFLDRVETFAKSEGMNDETLLSSIKHLLMDDALDWYARAMSQRLLYSWQAFKQEIRREFLPSGYAQILRLEASFRFQGQNETFAKYYRDIAALFRFISPPMSEEEKFFIVKKNMNADYAAIVTAARPADLREMVEVCTSYDETRMLLNRQRRIPVPHSALLEPNFATPTGPIKSFQQQQPLRFPRVNIVEATDRNEDHFTQHHTSAPMSTAEGEQEEADWQSRMDHLLQQVNALKGQFERKLAKPTGAINNHGHTTPARQTSSTSHPPQTPPAQQQQRWQAEQQQEAWQRTRAQQTHAASPSQYIHPSQQQQAWHLPQHQQQWQQQRPVLNQSQPLEAQSSAQQLGPNNARITMACWNCDEEGHRFMDCPKPQAVLFCYRCGRKGYSLRSCFTCRTDAGNQQAGNQQ